LLTTYQNKQAMTTKPHKVHLLAEVRCGKSEMLFMVPGGLDELTIGCIRTWGRGRLVPRDKAERNNQYEWQLEESKP